MTDTRLHMLWSNHKIVTNGWLTIANSFSAEVMANQGWDSLTIDMQHGLLDYQAMVTMLQAIAITNTVPVVRVPWLEPGILMKTVDAGAAAVLCPMINTQQDAEQFVSWTSYPPRGIRSYGPTRAILYDPGGQYWNATAAVVRFAMIETAQALDNLEAIASVDGIDAIYVGPSDLALSLGCRPAVHETDERVSQAIDYVLQCARDREIIAGIYSRDAASASKHAASGFRFISISSDARLLAAGSQAILATIRKE